MPPSPQGEGEETDDQWSSLREYQENWTSIPQLRTGDFPQEGEARADDRKGFPYGGKTLRLGDKPPILFPL